MRSRTKVAAGALLLAGTAQAEERIAYGYDARGRLVRVERSGGVNDGKVTTYVYDRADNRLAKTTAP